MKRIRRTFEQLDLEKLTPFERNVCVLTEKFILGHHLLNAGYLTPTEQQILINDLYVYLDGILLRQKESRNIDRYSFTLHYSVGPIVRSPSSVILDLSYSPDVI